MRIITMRTNQLDNPVGYDLRQPRFSWAYEGDEVVETTRIRIAEETAGLLFDSGPRADMNQLAYVAAGFTPEPKTRYSWTVEATTTAGTTVTSEPAYFETGKMDEAWQAKWITAPFPQHIHPYFHRGFEVGSDLQRARIYCTALGIYELELNGQRIGDEVLAPFYNDYRFRLQTQVYDVTELLAEGPNALGAMLGNGWYKGRFGFSADVRQIYGDHFGLLLELELEYADGTVELVTTDESWTAQPSAVQDSNIYDGEIYDASRDIPGRATVDCDLTHAQPARILPHPYHLVQARFSPPLREIEPLQATLLHTPAGEQVLDFGQNLTGWVAFTVEAPVGTVIRLQHGEILQDAQFYNTNLRTARAEYVYISDGTRQTVRPRFTFFGFRYVKVTGVDVKPEDWIAHVIHSDLPETGSIVTGSAKVNRLIQNARWGQKGNFLDVPTDCPQRDERMGWTGDAQAFVGTAAYNMHVPAFYDKYLQDMASAQRELGGAAPHVVPDVINMIYRQQGQTEDAMGSCGWGDAAAVIPWTMYLRYGDIEALRSQYANMTMWVEYIHRQDELAGGKRLWSTGFHYADWLALDNPDKQSSFGGTDRYYVASAYYYYSTSLTARAARVLGRTSDAERYEQLAQEVLTAVRAEYFDDAGHCTIQTQTAQVLAIYFGLAPDESIAAADLIQLLDANGGYLTTGFVGTAYLCLALSQVGRHDYAYRLLLNEEIPSWLYEVNMGATTIWERWNSVLPDGSLSDTGMNSLNHYTYGAVVEWIYRVVCGLEPVESAPGWASARIVPTPDRRLGSARAEFASPYGLYVSGWTYTADELVYEVRIPNGATATFDAALPGDYTINGQPITHSGGPAGHPLTAGSYEIRCAAE